MVGAKIVIAFICGFMIAQVVKLLIAVFKGEAQKEIVDFKSAISFFCRSGGMPSGHAASFAAATICIGETAGFSSPVFALAICTMVIVIYDAINVRYVVGEQGKILNKMIDKPIKIAEGHTLLEVFVGLILGGVIGFIFLLLF